ncbi:unnamed protein product [Schistocephalus solidus]|uniref:Cystatin domain-containing protein n=1 Tax=Schistocephalus solidus TaxID=70667 RepID=A0A183S7I3_SCHSO|nr:unnamed protein product [Schistocephalus solidus]
MQSPHYVLSAVLLACLVGFSSCQLGTKVPLTAAEMQDPTFLQAVQSSLQTLSTNSKGCFQYSLLSIIHATKQVGVGTRYEWVLLVKPKLISIDPACSVVCGTMCETEQTVTGWHYFPPAANNTAVPGTATLM